MERSKGHYLGTEINAKWWRRYRGEGFFARGNGEWWFDDEYVYFRSYLSKQAIKIARRRIISIKTGNWHAGRWATGMTIMKIMWNKDNLRLSAGFVVSKEKAETMQFVDQLLNK